MSRSVKSLVGFRPVPEAAAFELFGPKKELIVGRCTAPENV